MNNLPFHRSVFDWYLFPMKPVVFISVFASLVTPQNLYRFCGVHSVWEIIYIYIYIYIYKYIYIYNPSFVCMHIFIYQQGFACLTLKKSYEIVYHSRIVYIKFCLIFYIQSKTTPDILMTAVIRPPEFRYIAVIIFIRIPVADFKGNRMLKTYPFPHK